MCAAANPREVLFDNLTKVEVESNIGLLNRRKVAGSHELSPAAFKVGREALTNGIYLHAL